MLSWLGRKGLWSLNELNGQACKHLCVPSTQHEKSLQGNSRKTKNKSSGHCGTYMPLAMKKSYKKGPFMCI